MEVHRRELLDLALVNYNAAAGITLIESESFHCHFLCLWLRPEETLILIGTLIYSIYFFLPSLDHDISAFLYTGKTTISLSM